MGRDLKRVMDLKFSPETLRVLEALLPVMVVPYETEVLGYWIDGAVGSSGIKETIVVPSDESWRCFAYEVVVSGGVV